MSVQRQSVSIVVPFYNEDAGIEVFYDTLCPVMDALSDIDFEVVCVDDGSKDKTLACLLLLTQRDARFRVVELSRNFGKEVWMQPKVMQLFRLMQTYRIRQT